MEKLAETVRGSYSEQLFRGVVEKLPRTASHIRTEAARAYGTCAMDKCLSLIKQTAQAAPDDYRLALDQAKVLVQQGHYVEAAKLLGSLPDDAHQDPEIELLTRRPGGTLPIECTAADAG